MNRVILPVISIFLIFLSSCGLQEKKDAQAFYDRINSINDTLGSMTDNWHVLLDTALAHNTYTELNPFRIKLGAYISQVRSEVVSMKTTKKNEKIKKEEDLLLEKQQQMLTEVYPIFEQYSEFTPSETLNGALKQLGNDNGNVHIGLEKIRKLLTQYQHEYKLRGTGAKQK